MVKIVAESYYYLLLFGVCAKDNDNVLGSLRKIFLPVFDYESYAELWKPDWSLTAVRLAGHLISTRAWAYRGAC